MKTASTFHIGIFLLMFQGVFFYQSHPASAQTPDEASKPHAKLIDESPEELKKMAYAELADVTAGAVATDDQIAAMFSNPEVRKAAMANEPYTPALTFLRYSDRIIPNGYVMHMVTRDFSNNKEKGIVIDEVGADIVLPLLEKNPELQQAFSQAMGADWPSVKTHLKQKGQKGMGVNVNAKDLEKNPAALRQFAQVAAAVSKYAMTQKLSQKPSGEAIEEKPPTAPQPSPVPAFTPYVAPRCNSKVRSLFDGTGEIQVAGKSVKIDALLKNWIKKNDKGEFVVPADQANLVKNRIATILQEAGFRNLMKGTKNFRLETSGESLIFVADYPNSTQLQLYLDNEGKIGLMIGHGKSAVNAAYHSGSESPIFDRVARSLREDGVPIPTDAVRPRIQTNLAGTVMLSYAHRGISNTVFVGTDGSLQSQGSFCIEDESKPEGGDGTDAPGPGAKDPEAHP